jgi:hybrid cluster-associated redox disulfide protein
MQRQLHARRSNVDTASFEALQDIPAGPKVVFIIPLLIGILQGRNCRIGQWSLPRFQIASLFEQAQRPSGSCLLCWRFDGARTGMKPTAINPSMTVDEIMRRWPATIRVFMRYRMLCIGCPIGVFHTVADACEAHGLDEEAFSHDLLDAMRNDDSAGEPSAFESADCAQEPAQGYARHSPGKP